LNLEFSDHLAALKRQGRAVFEGFIQPYSSRQEGVRVGASDEMKVIFLHAAANAETFWFWLALSALRTKGLPRLDTMECETQWSWEKKSAKHTKDPDMLELCLACAAGSEGFAWIC